MAKHFYAVKTGRKTGIFENWQECKASVNAYPGAIFRGFQTRQEAKQYLTDSSKLGSNNENSKIVKSKPRSKNKQAFLTSIDASVDEYFDVYTDGAASRNGYAGARAGWGVYYGPNDERNACGRITDGRPTNQRAELMAISKALDQELIDVDNGIKHSLRINTDSQFSINCVTRWGEGWDRNGYYTANKKQVAHEDLIREIRRKIATLKTRKMTENAVVLRHVRGHDGNPGNEAADKLAVSMTMEDI